MQARPPRSISVAVPSRGSQRLEERAFSLSNIDEEISRIAVESLVQLSSYSCFPVSGVRAKAECLDQDYTSHRIGICFPHVHCPLDLSAGSRVQKRRRIPSRPSLPQIHFSDTHLKPPERQTEDGKKKQIPAIYIHAPQDETASSREHTDPIPQVEFKRQVSQAPVVSRKFRGVTDDAPEPSESAKSPKSRAAAVEAEQGLSVKFHIGGDESESPLSQRKQLPKRDSEAQHLRTRKKTEHRKSHGQTHHQFHGRKHHSEDEEILPRRRRGSDVHWDKFMERQSSRETSPLSIGEMEDVNAHRFERRMDSQTLSPDSYKYGPRLSIPSPVKPSKRKKGRQEAQEFTSAFLFPKTVDHKPHELFVEMDELYVPTSMKRGEMQWRETARWVKYEETLEAGAEKWGKPHVSSLSFHSLLELRKCIEDGSLLFDLDETDMLGIAQAMVDAMVVSDQITTQDRPFILEALLLPHEHVKEGRPRLRRQLTYNSLDLFFYRQHSLASPLINITSQDVLSDQRSPSETLQNGILNGGDRASLANIVKRKLSSRRISERRKESSPESAVHSVPVIDVLEEEEENRTTSALLEDSRGSRMLRGISFKFDKLASLRKLHQSKSAEKQSELFKCLQEGTEAASVCVGAVDFLEKPAVVLVRLSDPQCMPRVTEVCVPVRFFFLLLGPLNAGIDYHEVGRSIATLLSNKVLLRNPRLLRRLQELGFGFQRFRETMYRASVREDVLHAINEFLDDSIVLPPGVCDKKDLLKFDDIKVKAQWISQRRRALTARPSEFDKSEARFPSELIREDIERLKGYPLRRTGSCFGGLRREFRNRLQHCRSDFVDGLNVKCVSTVAFMFLACFFPAITFGAILSQKTKGQLGVKETILATSVGGVLFALFSAQPILLIGVNGTMLIFEQSLFKFCKVNGIGFLTARVWVSVWGAAFCLITVALEGSFLIQFVTRFSDDILNSLVSVIFVTECILFLTEIFELHPVMHLDEYCEQSLNDSTSVANRSDSAARKNMASFYSESEFLHYSHKQLPNTALLTTVLVIGTFILAYALRGLRNSKFFGRKIRRAVGDFGLSLAVIIMGLFDYVLNDDSVTSKLNMKWDYWQPAGRDSWVVSPFPVQIWMPFALLVAGLLFFLILFMETEVGEMELAKKEHGLRKGTGYHWDLVLTSLICCGCSLLGLPWICALSVQSVAHLNSLTRYQRAPPGQKPPVREVLEQRVTGVWLHLLIGLCLLIPQVLNRIPVPVLFGVFLYLGIMNVKGVQMLSRTLLLFVPVKYHPSHVYCLRVQPWRMHLYTVVQLVCFSFVVSIKTVKMTSFAFPFTVMVTVLVRHWILPCVFTEVELLALDGEENVAEDGDFYEGRLPV